MSHIEKEKLIKADIASIENRVRHAFNQGYDLGFKDGKSKQPNCSEIPTGSTTKNCRTCRNFGSHHGICEICKDNKCWTEKEPTTKNYLGVDAISRIETIDYLCKHCPDDGECFKDCDEIKHLRELPSVTLQEPKIVSIAEIKYDKDKLKELVNKAVLTVIPQEPKVGHWIDINYHHYYNDGDIETTELRCSCCNEEVEWDIELLHKPYYCENCGAKMVEPQESEE